MKPIYIVDRNRQIQFNSAFFYIYSSNISKHIYMYQKYVHPWSF